MKKITFLAALIIVNLTISAQDLIQNGETGLITRNKINGNFMYIYGRAHNLTDSIVGLWSIVNGKLSTTGSAANLTNFPTFNQNTTGTAAGITNQYIDWNASSGGTSIKNKPTIPNSYTLPIASASVLGGVKVGSGLSINGSGVLSSNSSGASNQDIHDSIVANALIQANDNTDGYLSSDDWTTFNNKASTTVASSSQTGLLSSTNWTTFNNKLGNTLTGSNFQIGVSNMNPSVYVLYTTNIGSNILSSLTSANSSLNNLLIGNFIANNITTDLSDNLLIGTFIANSSASIGNRNTTIGNHIFQLSNTVGHDNIAIGFNSANGCTNSKNIIISTDSINTSNDFVNVGYNNILIGYTYGTVPACNYKLKIGGNFNTPLLDGDYSATKYLKINGYIANTVGSVVSSSSTITPTGVIFHLTGTTTINTINLPYTGFTGSITIIPDGIWTTGTSGNIALVTTSIVSKALNMTYDGTKWYPSY